MEKSITFRSCVHIKIVYMTKFRVIPTANKFFRPYLSPSLGNQSSVLAQPMNYAEPSNPTLMLEAHIRSSLPYQFSRVFSLV